MSKGAAAKKDDEEDDKPRVPVDPVVTRPDLVAWFDKLWGDGRALQLVELRLTRHRKGVFDRLTKLDQVVYPASSKAPGREALNELSNWLVQRAQGNCNAIGKKQLYGVFAYHTGSADDNVGAFILNLSPTERPGGDAGGGGGEDDGHEGGGEDDVFGSTPLSPTLRFMLEQSRDSLADRRFIIKDSREAMEALLERLAGENARLSTMVRDGFNQMIEMTKTHQQLLNQDQERKLRARWTEVGVGAAEKTVETVMNLLPVAVNRMTGKETVPTRNSLESVVVSTFIKSVTPEQAKVAFGIQGEGMPVLPNAIFTSAQAELLGAIAACQVPADQVDAFLPGGPLEITSDQFAKAQSLFGMEQLFPLGDLFRSRMSRRVPSPSPKP